MAGKGVTSLSYVERTPAPAPFFHTTIPALKLVATVPVLGLIGRHPASESSAIKPLGSSDVNGINGGHTAGSGAGSGAGREEFGRVPAGLPWHREASGWPLQLV